MVAILEHPRLTSALREASQVSYETIFLQAQELMKRRTAEAQESREKPVLEGSESKIWSEIAALDTSSDQKKRQLYRGFLKVLKQMCGEQSDLSQLAPAAVLVLRAYGDGSKQESELRQQLFPSFGTVEPSLLREIAGLCKELSHHVPVPGQAGQEERTLTQPTAEFGRGEEIRMITPEVEDLEELFSSLSLPTPRGSGAKGPRGAEKRPSASNEPAQAPAEVQGDAQDDEVVNRTWLKRNIERYLNQQQGGVSVQDVTLSVCDLLLSSREDADIQSELFDLLGFESFTLVKSLLDNRDAFLDALALSSEEVSQAVEAKKEPKPVDPSASFRGARITVMTESEKRLQKAQRKEERKNRRKGKAEFKKDDLLEALGFGSPESLRQKRLEELEKASQGPVFSNRRATPQIKYPHVYSSMPNTALSVFGTRFLLPIGTVRNNFKEYEEVLLPESKRHGKIPNERVVEIDEFDEFARNAFRSYKSLNRLQSLVFDVAYSTNENMLVCAPTGAGKTDVAMMTVLHELKKHVSGNYLARKDFKVIYIAPMKALAAEVVEKFSSRLRYLGVTVNELTGDMQLTKAEIEKTQMIVTTPEKWDVVTRKSSGDVGLAQQVQLLIIDEVHLLHDDRGPVIESLIARTLRQVESTQSMIRIVGLSATLPNYLDVAQFLRVNPMVGLFYFDNGFRPVPLSQGFIGIKQTNPMRLQQSMNEVCYEKALERVKQGYQVMIFVHSRKDTFRTAELFREFAKERGDLPYFEVRSDPKFEHAKRDVAKAKGREIKDLFASGFTIHHAGMLRADRNLVEKLFSQGMAKVLVCTATLAWGVNLPAHSVIIKGTQVYNAEKGAFGDLGILDVMQIFGRAGRPQFDTSGEGIIITSHDRLAHYLAQMTQQTPIESQFVSKLTDNLNAEITLGTVTNVHEAMEWLNYTYLFVRMRRNPLHYGIPLEELENDRTLHQRREDLIKSNAQRLDKAKMIRYEERTGYLSATDLGRTASHFYIKYETIETFNEKFVSTMKEADLLGLLSLSSEFENVKVRDEELSELDAMLDEVCVCQVKGGAENSYGKVNILLQNYISRGRIEDFSLISDSNYVAQNAARVTRALFEVSLKRGWTTVAHHLLDLSKSIDHRMWPFEHPMRQFTILPPEIIMKLEQRNSSLENLRDMEPKEIGELVRHVRMGGVIKGYLSRIPNLQLDVAIQPITRTVLRVQVTIRADFAWDDRFHGKVEPWWIWIEDPDNEHIYHSEYFLLHKKQHKEEHKLAFTIPIFEPLPTQYYLRAVSDRWMGAENVIPISFQHLILPERHPPHTELLDLQPLPVSALQDPGFEKIFAKRFSHFNPIQTQIFHTLYHTDYNVLLGAPTGSGKTIAAEVSMFRVFKGENKHAKVVYIAPLKALVRERVMDWSERIAAPLNKKLVELTGDVTPDLRSIQEAQIIITTPEKWDGVSRSWQSRDYVQAVTLVIFDEIHLLGQDRGPTLEVIVSRMNYMGQRTGKKVRIVGLSTALANARDVADWMGIDDIGLFNFRPSVRPVPLEVHISGFPGKHYCPRMASMNKPTYSAIKSHSPNKPVIVFVSSRRQTRLTAQDLISFCGMELNPRQFLSIDEEELEVVLEQIRDSNLRFSLQFGIGLHHAGLVDGDRRIVERLFVERKIQVLVATSTLAWGVNTPTHLVVVKGTEFFDAKSKRYVDMPITDVLQMMGRAGRPQFDDSGKAVILVHDAKKNFYKKFLYEPFPVESSLHLQLHEHINAEVVGGTISSKQDAVDYITWTYFFRRMLMNPTYYNLEDAKPKTVNQYLSQLLENTFFDLENNGCVEIDGRVLRPTMLGKIASYYYLHPNTVGMFKRKLRESVGIKDIVQVLCDSSEYEEFPVRHNEDAINADLAEVLPWKPKSFTFDSPHTKAMLLLQAHFERMQLPISDYYTDLKSVLDQAVRILQAMVDVAGAQGFLTTATEVMRTLQCVKQARWYHDSHLLWLPHVTKDLLDSLQHSGDANQFSPLDLVRMKRHEVERIFSRLPSGQVKELANVVESLPDLSVTATFESPEILPGKECTLLVEIVSKNRGRHGQLGHRGANRARQGHTEAYTPYYPKPQTEGWWVMVGDWGSDELLALKRISFGDRILSPLTFTAPVFPGEHTFQVYVMSDCYMGLDHTLQVPFTVADPPGRTAGATPASAPVDSPAASAESSPPAGQ